jgi:lipopolysaccharide transport system ATP-binding protein
MARAIELENVSKLYRLGEFGTGSLTHDLNRWWHKMRGKDDPYQKIGQINDRTRKTSAQYVWALKDISFSVEQGDILGIVGKNGAGKSTLLKILSKVTGPTKGSVGYNGRIASLLEVGTGFHPELTGIENVYMNATILGMKNQEVKARMEEILEFAGVGMYADTPVKRYSSGMTLRLAFSVAAHLEAEILIVDEVLAVGDSDFQKKAVGKMQDVSQSSGKTVLFVSHNLPSLKSLCKTGVLLEHGMVARTGTIGQVLESYTSRKVLTSLIRDKIHYFQDHLRIHSIFINGSDTCSVQSIDNKLKIQLEIEFIRNVRFDLDIHIMKNVQPVASFGNFVFNKIESFSKGKYFFEYDIILPQMRSGIYSIDLCFSEPCASWFAICNDSIELEIINSNHDAFLNVEELKWGTTLLDGTVNHRPSEAIL